MCLMMIQTDCFLQCHQSNSSSIIRFNWSYWVTLSDLILICNFNSISNGDHLRINYMTKYWYCWISVHPYSCNTEFVSINMLVRVGLKFHFPTKSGYLDCKDGFWHFAVHFVLVWRKFTIWLSQINLHNVKGMLTCQ